MKEVRGLDPVDGDRVQRTVPVDCDSLPRPPQDTIGALVGLGEWRVDCIHADKDVGAVGEILAHEGFLR